MLRFQNPLTAAAREIIVYCLEISADEMLDFYEDYEVWAAVYPLFSTCFTRDLARTVLLDLLEKLDAPELYVPTDYHWLLMYECLKAQITVFNDQPVPSLVERLRTLADERDESYLHLPNESSETTGVAIDFGWLIEEYFWDTDFLTDAEMFSRLAPHAKQQLGFSEGLFGVIHGLTPHPEELVLKRWKEYKPEPSGSQ
jgi:hypothetical protein